MLVLKSKPIEPPCGWKYIDPTTGARFEASRYKGLLEVVDRYLQFQKLSASTEDSEQKLLDYLKWLLPKGWVLVDGSPFSPPKLMTRGVADPALLMAASRAMFEFLKEGGKFTSMEVAQERGNACKNCPFNGHLKGCNCAPFYKALNLVLPNERKNPELGVCQICGCSLQLKTSMPDGVVEASNKGLDSYYPTWCWQNIKKQ